jgi:NAD dependent epimerase/dehydratase family enzyme
MVFLLQMGCCQKMTIDGSLKADFIIHLAGENIAEKRWTENEKLKLSIVEQSTQLLYSVLKE